MVDIIGATNQTNHSDEQQQKLDVFANQAFKKALINRDIVCGFASEEEDSFVSITSTSKKNQNNYVVLVDPLDGSSNIDTNVSVGTIFSIFRRITGHDKAVEEKDFLQKGTNQVAAGYVLYGTSTMSDSFALGLRGESFDIKDTNTYTSLTLTGSYTSGNLTLKPEIRIDSADEQVSAWSANGTDSLSSFVLAAIYSF